ncbi:MAG: patatin-like phospholipase family protein, partial [Candidatus Brocadiales bacterium]|nr:patatin-like phospholipase family protein [Candidatus Brocadiales bacterium]
MSDPEQKPSKTDEEFKKIPLYKVLEKEYEEIHGDLHNSYIDEIGLLTFCEDEFKPPLTIKKLCEAIGKDTIEKIPTNTCDNLINRLNVLLGMPDFYNNLHNKKPDIIFSKDVMELVANTKECREKVSESLDGKEKLKLKKLNRLLLEEAYPQETPKYQKKGISEIYKRIHNLESKRSALCLSGGGIRSAAFALGVIQCLARYKLLDKFDYLSTVSGGGYIGSWLTAWIQNHEQGLAGVAEELENVPKSQLDHEPKPIKHLRSYTNYLTPKLGIMSADVWTLVATYLRNLLLNWFLFIPLLLAALIIPRFCVTVVLSQPHSFLIPFTLGVGSVAVVFAIYYIGVNCPGSSSKNNRDQKLFLPMCLLPLIISAVSLTTYWAWYSKEGTLSIWHFIGFGAMLHLIGWLAYSVRLCQFSGKESFVVLLTGALGGLFAWLMATSLFPDINMFAGHYVCFAAPSFLGLFLITGVLLVGFLGRYFEDKDLEWLARFGAWVLIAITIWSAVSSLVIFGPVGLLKLWEKVPTLIASLGGISGIITLFFSFSSKTPFGRKQKENNGLISALINNVLIISASIFIVFLIMLLSLGTDPIVRLVNNKLSTKIFQTKIIDRSDFWSGEFTSEATIEKLCDTINKDLYPISTENTIQSVKELNDLLTLEAFYGIITEKKRDIKFSDEITELVYKIKKDSYKNDPNLNDDKKSNIKRLNRLLLEEAYPQKTPKSRNPYSHIGLIFNNPLITLVILFLGLVVIVAIMCIPID